MKNIVYSIGCVILLLLATACTTAPQSHSLYPQSPDFTGEYRFKYPGNESLTLKCTSNTQCNMSLSYTSPTDEKTGKGTDYARATPIKDTSQLQFALEYAQQHRNASSATDEDKHTIKALAPLLDQKNYKFDNCIDLDPEGMPQYLVACKPQSTPWAKPTVFLFGTLISGTCGDPFCRYVIIPLHVQASP